MRIYLDTSVPSAYFDQRTPKRQKITKKFWDKVYQTDKLLISNLVLAELKGTRSKEKRDLMLSLVSELEILKQGPEVFKLAERFVEENLVPQNKIDDAIHLALAGLHEVDVLVSWNFRHMVNLKTKQKLPLVFAKSGWFHRYEIVSPLEYFEAENG